MATANRERNMKWVSGLNAAMGVAVAAAPLRLDLTPALEAFQVAAGLLVVTLAAATLYAVSQEAPWRARWSASAAFALGLTILAAPFVAGAAGTGAAALNLVAGSVLTIGAGYNAWNAAAAAARVHGAGA